MTGRAEPELQLVRKAAPFGLPAAVLALALGTVVGGWGVGWSAALGIVVVALNFAASGVSISWAARVSLTAIAAVVMGGFVVRMAAIVSLLFVLDRFAGWFSPLAFGLAVVPATILLLLFELRVLAGGLGSELVLPPVDKRAVR